MTEHPERERTMGLGRCARDRRRWLSLSGWTIPLLALALAACPEEPPEPEPEPECKSSADCLDLADDIGRLCVGGECTACSEAADCADDSRYGADAVCITGLCTTCVDGEVGCACLDGQYCIEGAGCDGDLCQPCTRGAAGCACGSDDACDDGLECTDGLCVGESCSPGEEGCVCDDGACDVDLTCGEETCRACPVTTEGCPCDSGACGIDLVCDADSERCREATSCNELDCGDHRLCGQLSGSYRCLEECETGYEWNDNTQACDPITGASCDPDAPNSILADCQALHRACVPETVTVEAHCGACVDDGVECWLEPIDGVGEACRPPVTCDDCAADNRDCTAATGCADAVCGACLTGYHDEGGTCVAHVYTDCGDCATQHRTCVSDAGGDYCGACEPYWTENAQGDCVPLENCDVGAPNSRYEECAALGRSCEVDPVLLTASCTDCLDGYAYNPTFDVCVSEDPCASDADCPPGTDFHCIQTDTSDIPMCQIAGCSAGEALDRFRGGCRACPTCPSSGGFTGVLWPVTDADGDCLCATAEGYFIDDASATQAEECDHDGDGWLNGKVYEVFRRATDLNDMAQIINTRCAFNHVTDFVLVNEWGQQLVLNVSTRFGQPSVVLYESVRNDRNDDVANLLPVHGGRSFDPAEVNSLTKVCMGGVDLNENTRTDLVEAQAAGGVLPWQSIFNQLSFFTELYWGSYDAVSGRYYIYERSRCEAGFPLAYSTDDPSVRPLDPNDPLATSYWQGCTRRRDSGYSPTNLRAYDFAQYHPDGSSEPRECHSNDEACLYTWPDGWGRAPDVFTAEPPVPPQSFVEIPIHGVCDTPRPVEDVPWRGMTHYSQFRCAKLMDPPGGTIEEVDIDDVAFNSTFDARTWHVNECGLGALGASGSVAHAPIVYGCDQSVAASPSIAHLQGQVVWLAKRYQDYVYDPDNPVDTYAGGCINESAEWPQLCPGYLESSNPRLSIQSMGDPNHFGQLVCGCGEHYGGISCEIGCPDPLHAIDDWATRSGTWLCGQIAASEAPVLTDGVDGGYSLRGAVPAHVSATQVLCQAADGGACVDGGYSISASVLP